MDYTIYTDGGYSQMHDEGAFAYVMLNQDNKIIRCFSKKITHETNNRAELKAIIAGIYHLPNDATKVLVVSDSQYALNTLFGGWSRGCNLDLFDVFEDIVKSKPKLEISYQWVKGHSGDEYNDMCDELCNKVLGYNVNAEFERYKKYKKLRN